MLNLLLSSNHILGQGNGNVDGGAQMGHGIRLHSQQAQLGCGRRCGIGQTQAACCRGAFDSAVASCCFSYDSEAVFSSQGQLNDTIGRRCAASQCFSACSLYLFL
jgi:hypothetical protein